MHIFIEFHTDNAAFEDDGRAYITDAIMQSVLKIEAQMRRPEGCTCTAPEAADKLLDTNGNTIGSVRLERS